MNKDGGEASKEPRFGHVKLENVEWEWQGREENKKSFRELERAKKSEEQRKILERVKLLL